LRSKLVRGRRKRRERLSPRLAGGGNQGAIAGNFELFGYVVNQCVLHILVTEHTDGAEDGRERGFRLRGCRIQPLDTCLDAFSMATGLVDMLLDPLLCRWVILHLRYMVLQRRHEALLRCLCIVQPHHKQVLAVCHVFPLLQATEM
jgi:hypothetical protein